MLTPADIAALPPDERFMWQKLDASGLRPDDLDAVVHYDFAGNAAGFRIPYHRADGTLHPLMHRVRLERPAPGQGKYTQPSTEQIIKAGYPALDVRMPYLNHKLLGGVTWEALGRTKNKTLLLVEGELKAVCAGKYLRVPAVGLPGCWGGTVQNERNIHHVNPVIAALIQPGDWVGVVLDGDILTNPDVNRAAGTLKRALARLGVKPVFVLLPPPPPGIGAGLDDWLVRQVAGDQRRAFAALPRSDGGDFKEDFASVADYFGLAVGKTGVALPTMSNMRKLMEKHERYTSRYFFDVMRDNLYRNERTGPEPMTDAFALDEVVWLQDHIGMTIPKMHALDCLRWMADQPRWQRNLLLEALPAWDGTTRLETMFIDGWGAPDNMHTRAVGRNWLTSALARAMKPGCKVDTMLVLVGPQGIGKSKSLQIIGGDLYVQTHAQVHDKDFMMSLHRGWLIDMAELSSMNHSDAAQVKGIISSDTDNYRPPYAAVLIEKKRHSVIVGTTNEERFLRDQSGNRRFWPVACGVVNIAWIEANRLQLLAEAKARVEIKEDWWTMPAATTATQEARMEIHQFDEPLTVILSSPQTMRIVVVAGVSYRYITNGELLDALGIEVRFRKPHHFQDLAAAIRRITGGAWEPTVVNQIITKPNGGTMPISRGYRQLVTGNPTATVIDLPTRKF